MSFLILAGKRGSVRAYENLPVSNQELEQILEAGRMAPSAANYQPWHFIVIRDPDVRQRLATEEGRRPGPGPRRGLTRPRAIAATRW